MEFGLVDIVTGLGYIVEPETSLLEVFKRLKRAELPT